VDELEQAFSRISERIRRLPKGSAKAELLFFFSGHGDVEQGEGYVDLQMGVFPVRPFRHACVTRDRELRNY
jgi:hypothetical protein